MSFDLKNVGVTYQRIMGQLFEKLLGKTMEVYINDMLVKSISYEKHMGDLQGAFNLMRQHRLYLNPAKCALGVEPGKFLGHLVSQRGIEACLDQIKTVPNMPKPTTFNHIQSLTGKLTPLNRFILRSSDKLRPFFSTLKGSIKKVEGQNVKKHSTLLRNISHLLQP